MKVYLAAAYGRRDELNLYRGDLEHIGVEVTSRWLTEAHTGTEETMGEYALAQFAEEDLADVDAADLMVNFTEPAGQGPARGGRHVEYGYAVHARKPIIIVQHQENVFHRLHKTRPYIRLVGRWSHALEMIARTLFEDTRVYRRPAELAAGERSLQERIAIALLAARSREPAYEAAPHMFIPPKVWTKEKLDAAGLWAQVETGAPVTVQVIGTPGPVSRDWPNVTRWPSPEPAAPVMSEWVPSPESADPETIDAGRWGDDGGQNH